MSFGYEYMPNVKNFDESITLLKAFDKMLIQQALENSFYQIKIEAQEALLGQLAASVVNLANAVQQQQAGIRATNRYIKYSTFGAVAVALASVGGIVVHFANKYFASPTNMTSYRN